MSVYTKSSTAVGQKEGCLEDGEEWC